MRYIENTVWYEVYSTNYTYKKHTTFELHISYRVASHFVPRSFGTQVISYLLWSFRTYFLGISYPVTTISYPDHFVPISVISYIGELGTKRLYGGQFLPKSFRTLFGHFVPIFVISYPAKMDGWTNGRTGVFWLKWQINVLLLIVTLCSSLSFLKHVKIKELVDNRSCL